MLRASFSLDLSEMVLIKQGIPGDTEDTTVSDSANDNAIQDFKWNP